MVCDSCDSYRAAKAALRLLTVRRTWLLCLYLLLGIPLFSGPQHPTLRDCAHPASKVQSLPKHKKLNLPFSLPSILLQHLPALLYQRLPSLLVTLSSRYFSLYQGNDHCNPAKSYSLQAKEDGAVAMRQGVDPRKGLFLHGGSEFK